MGPLVAGEMCAVGPMKDLRTHKRYARSVFSFIIIFLFFGRFKAVAGPRLVLHCLFYSTSDAANMLAEGRMVSHPVIEWSPFMNCPGLTLQLQTVKLGNCSDIRLTRTSVTWLIVSQVFYWTARDKMTTLVQGEVVFYATLTFSWCETGSAILQGLCWEHGSCDL